MPPKRYEIIIDEENKIFVYFLTAIGEVGKFVVKYLAEIEGKTFEIVRYDVGHGQPHIDILNAHGQTKEKRWLGFLDNSEALTLAIEDIKANYLLYRKRFITWLKKEERK